MPKGMRKNNLGRILLSFGGLFFIFHLSLFFSSCAKQGYPTGGPKDSDPPKALECKPQNESRQFKAKQFYIEFNEYVVLKNAEQNVLVSPPLKHKAEYTVKGKGVQVRLHDTLQPNTTYLFQFKEAIADFTEGNLLPSYEYVFSTGDDMDTMMMTGSVLDARSSRPWKETLTVAAYREGDTMPAFVTRTNKEGFFAFHYIPAGNYRIAAFEDKNRDLRIDSTEAAAWDTLTYASTDSIDSTAMARLRISSPDRRKQRILKADFTDRGRITIATLLPMQHPLLSGEPLEWRLNPRGDSLNIWCLNALCDSTVLVFTTDEGLNDTLRLRYKAPSRKGSRGRGLQQQEKTPLMKALCSGTSAYYDDLRLGFTNPVTALTDSLFAMVMYMKDSSVTSCPVVLDSSGLTARLATSLHSGEQYSVRLRDSLFADLYGNVSDSLRFTLTPKDYGTLVLHLDNHTGSPLLVEVLDSKDTVVQRQQLDSTGTLRFIHLPAADYRLRAVIDRNHDGQWTPGDWFANRQPEECLFFEKQLQLREKWEMEERWTVGIGERNAESGEQRTEGEEQ